eukprot:m.30708 g.30708  ORF g.30708 m.30708 type:complete len:86 (+) comp13895_c0_seq5:1379-1636(+)
MLLIGYTKLVCGKCRCSIALESDACVAVLRVCSGSFNWTRSAVLYNRENVIITKDRSVINAFAAEFAKMWELYKSRTHIIAKTMV